MTTCTIHDSGAIELYFYDELSAPERAAIDDHLRGCRTCAGALAELRVIRTALAGRPDVAAPASGDWSSFMRRLEARIGAPAAPVALAFREGRRPQSRRSTTGLLAMAALLALVAASVFFASQASRRLTGPETTAPQTASAAPDRTGTAAPDEREPGSLDAALATVGARHLERSKLVVLGLAAREPSSRGSSEWAYERTLATSLLNDTRLYRQTAEQRGLTALAGVMRDLELVLLQTSMAQPTDETALPQIQRLIRKRGLVEKMDAAGTTGLMP